MITKRDVRMYHASIIAVVLVLGILAYILWLAAKPFKTPDILQPMPLSEESKVVERGGSIVFLVDYTKYQEPQSVSGSRTIECEDGNLVTLTSVAIGLPIGTNKVWSEDTLIPTKTSLGKCKLVVTVIYEVTHFKTVIEKYETEPFYVVPSKIEQDVLELKEGSSQ